MWRNDQNVKKHEPCWVTRKCSDMNLEQTIYMCVPFQMKPTSQRNFIWLLKQPQESYLCDCRERNLCNNNHFNKAASSYFYRKKGQGSHSIANVKKQNMSLEKDPVLLVTQKCAESIIDLDATLLFSRGHHNPPHSNLEIQLLDQQPQELYLYEIAEK